VKTSANAQPDGHTTVMVRIYSTFYSMELLIDKKSMEQLYMAERMITRKQISIDVSIINRSRRDGLTKGEILANRLCRIFGLQADASRRPMSQLCINTAIHHCVYKDVTRDMCERCPSHVCMTRLPALETSELLANTTGNSQAKSRNQERRVRQHQSSGQICFDGGFGKGGPRDESLG
jgi:hypothetical protein